MKVLVIGNGAREHALAWRLRQSPKVAEVFVAPGNPGVAAVATPVPIESSSIIELADFAQQLRIGLTIVGPELPLDLGIVDEFLKRGLKIFGPTQAAAEIESSKVFAKRFMRSHGIATADFEICSSPEEAEEFIERRPEERYPLVVKADGLAAGKGVTIARDRNDARMAVQRMMVSRAHGNAGERLVFEEFLAGPEISFQVVTDGRIALPLASAQDYKRLEDGDRGPNTGGMGAVSPARALTPELGRAVMKDIIMPTLLGLEKDGRRFVGVLYAGIVATAAGPKVLEFNARFGDPETQSLMPRLETDPLDLFLGAVDSHLDQVRIDWKKQVSVSVVVASGGYPGLVKPGQVITGIRDAEQHGATVFHAATALKDGHLVTSGGRVLTVNAVAPSRTRAVEIAYGALERIQFTDMVYRRDIGRQDGDSTLALLGGEA